MSWRDTLAMPSSGFLPLSPHPTFRACSLKGISRDLKGFDFFVICCYQERDRAGKTKWGCALWILEACAWRGRPGSLGGQALCVPT